MRDVSTCYTVETAVSKIPDGDTVESKEGNGSPIASLPNLDEAQKDERNTNSKSSLSSIYSAEKSAYSPMVGCSHFFVLAAWLLISNFIKCLFLESFLCILLVGMTFFYAFRF